MNEVKKFVTWELEWCDAKKKFWMDMHIFLIFCEYFGCVMKVELLHLMWCMLPSFFVHMHLYCMDGYILGQFAVWWTEKSHCSEMKVFELDVVLKKKNRIRES
jgi:hypothetical protein